MERFARLGVTGNFQPLWACKNEQNDRLTVPLLSARRSQPGANETTVPLLPAEAIGVDAAVDAFTRGVAYANHEEDVAGTLEPGKIADFAVLDQDIYAIPPRAIGDTSVALTIAGGQVVHGDE